MDANYMPAISAGFFITSIVIATKTNLSKISKLVFFSVAVCSILLYLAYGINYYFTGGGIDASTVYHVKYGLSGAGFHEYQWLLFASIIILLICVTVILLALYKTGNKNRSSKIKSTFIFSLLILSLFLNPTLQDLYKLDFSASKTTSISTKDDFNKFYKKPQIFGKSGKNKNFVFIYAESLEYTYFDKVIFPSLINGLRTIEKESISFTNIKQVGSTGWTIAGITSSQCGIPLHTPSHGNSMSGMDQFLSSATCLGDLLNEQGYKLSFFGGADLNFAGKGNFFRTHGFSKISGKGALYQQLENNKYMTGWGLYDDSLLDIVYNQFMELSDLGERFGLFTLTLDTHHPNGHPSKESCKDIKYHDGNNQILDAVACSDHLISKLIQKITHSRYAENTIIIVASDHLAMRNTAQEKLKNADRRNLFLIFEPGSKNKGKINSIGSTLDIGPTLLTALGFKGDIGLGRSLYSRTKKIDSEVNDIHLNLPKWGKKFSEFWNFPRLEKFIGIDLHQKSVLIDDRKFSIPIFIELDSNFNSILKFPVSRSKQDNSLAKYVMSANKNNGKFLAIEECKNINYLENSLGENGFCVITGNGKDITNKFKISNNLSFSAEEVGELINNQFA